MTQLPLSSVEGKNYSWKKFHIINIASVTNRLIIRHEGDPIQRISIEDNFRLRVQNNDVIDADLNFFLYFLIFKNKNTWISTFCSFEPEWPVSLFLTWKNKNLKKKWKKEKKPTSNWNLILLSASETRLLPWAPATSLHPRNFTPYSTRPLMRTSEFLKFFKNRYFSIFIKKKNLQKIDQESFITRFVVF